MCAIRLSTGIRNCLLGGTAGTQGLKNILDGGVLDIFTGAQPVNADAIETGSKLVRISSTSGSGISDGLRFGTAGTGFIPLTVPTWQGAVILAGVAGWARFYGTGGTLGASTIEKRMDMSVGVSGADLNLTHTSLALDTTLTIKTFNITEPAE
jgi:hypothetical protein